MRARHLAGPMLAVRLIGRDPRSWARGSVALCGILVLVAPGRAQVPQVLDMGHPRGGIQTILPDWGWSQGTRPMFIGDIDGDGARDLAIGGRCAAGGWVVVVFGGSRTNARFIRGEVNQDGRVDISDAVMILGYLFLGGVTPGCLAAADADDSDTIEITDAVFLLGALFLGTNVIPAPYPDCGTDPTSSEPGCRVGC